ncbi:MAG: c-type cytochrome biogenesis protein CcmI [Paenirhodobacter sp.]|uniref:c-type cytochrome biogenesis protein CcmI n=1 Tax=Paenirhodobacter sp. TaxID=1965326 RepID=UPI003D14ECA3
MLFWILAAALVAVIALLFALALMRRHPEEDASSASYDVQVYRDQLAEIEKDAARGVLSPEEAERTKVEIARRMLEADRASRSGQGLGARAGDAPKGATWGAVAGVTLLLVGALVVYDRMGANGYPDMPLAARFAEADKLYDSRPSQDEAEKMTLANRPAQPAPDPQFTELMERLRKAVAERPNDPRGLALLASNEMGLGNYHAGWQAQERYIGALGDKAGAQDYAQLGEYQVVAAGGLVTKTAEASFAKALEMDKTNGLALYYVGLMMAQNARGDRAFRIWDSLLRQSQPDDPWVKPIMDNIAELAWIAGEQNYTPPSMGRGPSAADMANAASMTPAERAEMIRGMVEQLNDRLATEGGPVEDWAKLVSSLRMLGETERAGKILTEARSKFAADPAALEKLDAAGQAPEGAAMGDMGGGAPSAGPMGGAPMAGPMAGGMPGPSAEQMKDAASMTPEERSQMIEGMVNGLVTRLESEGGSGAEWARAVSSLATLGKIDAARAVLAKAQTALADKPDDLAAVMAAAQAAKIAP